MDEAEHLALWAEPLDEAYTEETGASLRTLGPLSRVNIIVGANNAGKSRLMRALASRKRHVLVTGDELARFDRVLGILERLAQNNTTTKLVFSPEGSNNPNRTDIHPSTFSIARDALLGCLREGLVQGDAAGQLYRVELLAELYREEGTKRSVKFDQVQPPNLDADQMRACVDLKEFVEGFEIQVPPRVLIPAQRSAQTLWKDGPSRIRDDIFAYTFRHRYDGFPKDVPLWTGYELYDHLLRMQCAKREERSKKRAFERFLSRAIFAGRDVELIAQLGSGATPLDAHVNFVLDQTEHPFFDVGDGVGAITLLLYPLFNAADGTWAFVEEPENHLHPAFQRIFVEALVRDSELRKRDLRVFLTTHSNHLLDVAMEYPDDVAVFSLSKHGQTFRIRRCQTRDIRLLETLGVRNGSVYLANCSIWVEGPTDVIYVRAFLEALMNERYQKKRPYQEDLHYAFLEYGGALLATYDFGDEASAKKVNAAVTANRVCIIADRDNGKDDRKHEPWRACAEGSAGALLYVTTVGREIENDLSSVLIKKIVAERLRLPAPPDGFEPAHCGNDQYLGRFMSEALAEHPKRVTVKGWEAKSGTLKPHVKQAFAEAAAAALREDSTLLGEHARQLATKILDFIERHNQGAGASLSE